MEEIIKFLNREVPSKILLILFAYKDGKIGDDFLGPLTITKLLYPNNPLFAGSVIENINELERFGIIYSKRERIENRKRRILFVNFRKFVDIFDYYYNLELTEEEKDFLAKWFSEVDWRVLVEGVFEEIIRGRLERNIIQIVGDSIRAVLDAFSFLRIDITKLNKLEAKEKKEQIIKIFEKFEKLKISLPYAKNDVDLNIYIDFYKKLLSLPNEILKKLGKLTYSSGIIEKLLLSSAFPILFLIINKKLLFELLELLESSKQAKK
ncbi:MAG: hypothetical protein QXP34_03650 [Candidatus Aenigmatarchaeota archaeon]